jgi:hypothetical protein
MEMTEQLKARMGLYAGIVRHLAPKVEQAYGVAILGEIGKDLRRERLIENRLAENGVDNDIEPATQKQIEYLKTLGIAITDKVSKKQASQMIDEATIKNR